ncbi:MAG: DUF4131 domain-containing protein, partial [Erythrobacter sp.]|nr:DUF4131 domain-containing protein [Erythrobacter sp.]
MSPPESGGLLPIRLRLLGRQIDAFLLAERQQLPLWGVVAFGAGIASWFWLPTPGHWLTAILIALGLSMASLALGGRLGRALAFGGLFIALGQGLIWGRSELVEAPRIERITITTFDARIERVEPLVARERVRLTLNPVGDELPPRLRVSLREAQAYDALREGAVIRLRARLTPPPTMAVPGGYDFARHAWFKRIGGVGSALGDVQLLRASRASSLDGVRATLGSKVRAALPGAGDGIATALATGDKNAV